EGHGVPGAGIGLHAVEEITGDVIHPEAQEVANLRAGDKDGDSVGEANDHRTGEILDGRAEARDAEENEEDACHQSASEEPVDALLCDDASDDDNEGSGGAADL